MTKLFTAAFIFAAAGLAFGCDKGDTTDTSGSATPSASADAGDHDGSGHAE